MVKNLALLSQLDQSFAQVIVLKMAAGYWVLIFLVLVPEVNPFEIVEI